MSGWSFWGRRPTKSREGDTRAIDVVIFGATALAAWGASLIGGSTAVVVPLAAGVGVFTWLRSQRRWALRRALVEARDLIAGQPLSTPSTRPSELRPFRGRLRGVEVIVSPESDAVTLSARWPGEGLMAAVFSNATEARQFPLPPLATGDAAFDEMLTLVGSDDAAWRAVLSVEARAALLTVARHGLFTWHDDPARLELAVLARRVAELPAAIEALVDATRALSPSLAADPVRGLAERLADPDELPSVQLAIVRELAARGAGHAAVAPLRARGDLPLMLALAGAGVPEGAALLAERLDAGDLYPTEVVNAGAVLAPIADAPTRARLATHLVAAARRLADATPAKSVVVALAAALAQVGGPSAAIALGPLRDVARRDVDAAVSAIRARHPQLDAGALALSEQVGGELAVATDEPA